MGIQRTFNIMENAHCIHNTFTRDTFATICAALRLLSGALGVYRYAAWKQN